MYFIRGLPYYYITDFIIIVYTIAMKINTQWLALCFVLSVISCASSSPDEDPPMEFTSYIGLNHSTAHYRSSPDAPAYYIDSQKGNDAHDGRSADRPWQSLSRLHSVILVPGDVVRLCRGSVWTGESLFFDNGSAGSPLKPVIIEAYGKGDLPHITKPAALWDKNKTWPAISFGQNTSSIAPGAWIRILDLHVSHIPGVAIALNGKSHDILIAGCEISQSAMGVSIAGENQKVIGCYIHDGVMGVDSGDPSKDWGANGVGVRGKNIEIAWNYFYRCIAPSKSFGTDGGAIEFFGYDSDAGSGWEYLSDNIMIHHNGSDGSDCFIEANGKVTRMLLSYNVSVNSPNGALLFHLNTIRTDTYYQVTLAHNVLDARNSQQDGWGLIGLLVDWNNLTSPNLALSSLTARNNIFITNYAIMNWINPIGNRLVHDHNVIHLVNDGRLSVNKDIWPANGETLGDPLFTDPASGDYSLTGKSPAIRAGLPIDGDTSWKAEALAVDLAGKRYQLSDTADCGAFSY